MSRTPRPICVCADDYALSAAVSRGILKALEAGRLSATSVMTNRPDWPRAAKALARLPDAEIGLHLNLTLGAPLTAAPTLAAAGRLPAIGALMRARTLPGDELRREIRAQIEAFGAALGRAPDYVDGHQHVQVLPAVRAALFDELDAAGLAGRIWVRDSGDRWARILARRTTLPKALGLAWIARGFAARAAARGYRTNDGFAGFSAFDPRRPIGADFARYTVAPGPRHLVMCHPGYVDDDLVALDPVTTTRERELAFLLSPEWPAQLARAGLRLGRWSAR